MKNGINENKKQYMSKYKKLLLIEARLKNKKKSLDQRIEKHNTTDTITELEEDKLELNDRIKRIQIRALKYKKDVLSIIDQITDTKLNEILKHRYIDCMEIIEISQIMKYSTRHTTRLLSNAIDKLEIPGGFTDE